MQDKFLDKVDESFSKTYRLIKYLVDEIRENCEWERKTILNIEKLEKRMKVVEKNLVQ